MCDCLHEIDWVKVLKKAQNWKHLKRRKYVKKLKRSIKRKKLAVLRDGKVLAQIDVKFMSSESAQNSDFSNTFFHGFKPTYDYVCQETVSLVVENLIVAVCQNEHQTAEFVAGDSVSNNNSSVSTLKLNDGSHAEVAESSRQSAEDDDLAKNIETERFLEELDEEVKKWHNPFLPEKAPDKVANPLPVPILNNQSDVTATSDSQVSVNAKPKEICNFYGKVGSCRFGDHCSRLHEKVEKSDTLLLSGMFSTFAFDIVKRAQKTSQGDVDDIWLEHSEADLFGEFVEFYDDVLPELETFGEVVQFKVCCNREKHLLGNVYVQYKNEDDAEKASKRLNGRYYGGKPLTVRYVSIKSWKKAICGLHYYKRNCSRGHHCNFLHVFKEPSRRFYNMDTDGLGYQQQRKRERYSERSTRRDSERSYYHRKSSRRSPSISPPYRYSPKAKKHKRSSKEHKSKHKKESKRHSKKHKRKKPKAYDSS